MPDIRCIPHIQVESIIMWWVSPPTKAHHHNLDPFYAVMEYSVDHVAPRLPHDLELLDKLLSVCPLQ